MLLLTGVAQKLTTALEAYNTEAKESIAIIITATDYNHNTNAENNEKTENENESKEGNENQNVQIISYPQGVIYSIPTKSDFNLFLRNIISNEKKGEKSEGADDVKKTIEDIEKKVENMELSSQEHSIPRFSMKNVPWKHIILVCVHASRDNRCGRAGPQVKNNYLV